ncbi:putative quinol monooxygenase [Sphingopyxis sp. RIFCSPHIGHO2_12_FULL_65_19]|uniref:putative quinol monooxygenase n=1 Tax=Sphingopyxis sp. RIFCSPHIGHO2_12_FULL_65_19 TaxID=1802172 RepID=UPI000A4C3C9A|nr:antibiotic biosynthesis monooxygenase [Sphingopyxis sp. RIFCSPHIGHO2_12_FULL_65_19]
MNRREHLAALLAMAAVLLPTGQLQALEARMEELVPEYGLIGQMMAQPGQRAALVAILSEGTGSMPGNMGYLIGEDSVNADAIWIVELWESKEAHAASLKLPAVQDAIKRGRPLIAGFGTRAEFKPVAKTGA